MSSSPEFSIRLRVEWLTSRFASKESVYFCRIEPRLPCTSVMSKIARLANSHLDKKRVAQSRVNAPSATYENSTFDHLQFFKKYLMFYRERPVASQLFDNNCQDNLRLTKELSFGEVCPIQEGEELLIRERGYIQFLMQFYEAIGIEFPVELARFDLSGPTYYSTQMLETAKYLSGEQTTIPALPSFSNQQQEDCERRTIKCLLGHALGGILESHHDGILTLLDLLHGTATKFQSENTGGVQRLLLWLREIDKRRVDFVSAFFDDTHQQQSDEKATLCYQRAVKLAKHTEMNTILQISRCLKCSTKYASESWQRATAFKASEMLVSITAQREERREIYRRCRVKFGVGYITSNIVAFLAGVLAILFAFVVALDARRVIPVAVQIVQLVAATALSLTIPTEAISDVRPLTWHYSRYVVTSALWFATASVSATTLLLGATCIPGDAFLWTNCANPLILTLKNAWVTLFVPRGVAVSSLFPAAGSAGISPFRGVCTDEGRTQSADPKSFIKTRMPRFGSSKGDYYECEISPTCPNPFDYYFLECSFVGCASDALYCAIQKLQQIFLSNSSLPLEFDGGILNSSLLSPSVKFLFNRSCIVGNLTDCVEVRAVATQALNASWSLLSNADVAATTGTIGHDDVPHQWLLHVLVTIPTTAALIALLFGAMAESLPTDIMRFYLYRLSRAVAVVHDHPLWFLVTRAVMHFCSPLIVQAGCMLAMGGLEDGLVAATFFVTTMMIFIQLMETVTQLARAGGEQKDEYRVVDGKENGEEEEELATDGEAIRDEAMDEEGIHEEAIDEEPVGEAEHDGKRSGKKVCLERYLLPYWNQVSNSWTWRFVVVARIYQCFANTVLVGMTFNNHSYHIVVYFVSCGLALYEVARVLFVFRLLKAEAGRNKEVGRWTKLAAFCEFCSGVAIPFTHSFQIEQPAYVLINVLVHLFFHWSCAVTQLFEAFEKEKGKRVGLIMSPFLLLLLCVAGCPFVSPTVSDESGNLLVMCLLALYSQFISGFPFENFHGSDNEPSK